MAEIPVSVGPINVSKVSAKLKKSVSEEMIKTGEKALKKATGVTAVPLPPPKKEGTAKHNISGNVLSFSAINGKVNMKVSMVIAQMPKKSMYGFATSGVASQGGTSDRAILLTTKDCAAALMEGFMKKAMPQIKIKARS